MPVFGDASKTKLNKYGLLAVGSVEPKTLLKADFNSSILLLFIGKLSNFNLTSNLDGDISLIKKGLSKTVNLFKKSILSV